MYESVQVPDQIKSHVQETDGTAQVRGNKGKSAQTLAGGAKQNHEVKAPW